jgi:hypothetical protein
MGVVMVMSRIVRMVTGSMFIVGLAGCGADPSDVGGGTSNSVNGVVREWSVTVDASSALAGEVTFTVTNQGSIGHEFLVVKTDIEVGKIPLDGDHFPEPADGLEVIDEISEFPKGTIESLTLTLEPGKYQLVCNLPGHYAAGMHAGFEVL